MTLRRCALLAVFALAPVTALAQGAGPPRTPWGHPDLQGIWSNATLTPLQRPADLASKAFFTPEEMAAYTRQRIEQTNADRPLRQGEVGAYNDAFFERGSRIVKTGRTSLIIDPPDGLVPPLTPQAQKRVEARQAAAARRPADAPEDRWLTERCILFGATVPMLPEPYNNHYRILQTPDHVIVQVEMNHDVRIIPLERRPPLSPAIQQWIGDSRGRWDGDTLVVETRNFKFSEQSRYGVQYLNGLSDEHLTIVERFTRTDDGTLMYRATIDNPTVYTKPWTVEIPMERAEGPIFEVACHEGNYGLGYILSGHRAEEGGAGSPR
jgi:hypothetical protein